MGALDFLKEFEDRAIDAANYNRLERNFQMQEDNNRLQKENADLLQAENVRLKAENQSLHSELNALREKLSQVTEASEYETREGFAFRRKSDGSFEETAFCPNCWSVMGNPSYFDFVCPNCGYVKKVRTLPQFVALQLNAELRKNV